MATPETQQIWIPYEIKKDCSQGFCSIHCPQWCDIIFPPPPPFGFPDEGSNPNFSPLVIAIIGILASAFLLVSYYTVVAKYCGNFNSLRRRIHRNPDEDLEESQNRTVSQNYQWHVATTGLEEALIKSITVCKYKRGDGLIEGTDCSVCLNEFQEDETLRLLPKCSHAFHLSCIDTWLQSHSNCPMCRANIASTPQPQQTRPAEEISGDGLSLENQADVESGITVDGLSSVPEETPVDLPVNFEGEEAGSVVSKVNFRALSDLGVVLSEQGSIIGIRDEETQPIRRSISMDSSCRNRVSIADILGMCSNDDFAAKDCRIHAGFEWSKREQNKGRMCREAYTNRILHSVQAPMVMKRSVSGGKFTGRGRVKTTIFPM